MSNKEQGVRLRTSNRVSVKPKRFLSPLPSEEDPDNEFVRIQCCHVDVQCVCVINLLISCRIVLLRYMECCHDAIVWHWDHVNVARENMPDIESCKTSI